MATVTLDTLDNIAPPETIGAKSIKYKEQNFEKDNDFNLVSIDLSRIL